MGSLSELTARARAFVLVRRARWRRPADDTLVDAGFLCGLAAVAAGCGWIYPPTAPIVGGLLLVTVCWRAGRPVAAEETPARHVERWYTDPEPDEDED